MIRLDLLILGSAWMKKNNNNILHYIIWVIINLNDKVKKLEHLVDISFGIFMGEFYAEINKFICHTKTKYDFLVRTHVLE